MKPISCSIILLSFGIPGVCVWSNTINPHPPTRNMNDDDNPEIVIYLVMHYSVQSIGEGIAAPLFEIE